MPKFTKKYFITEIPLRAGTHERAVLKKRFWAAKQQYNALLSESLKRLNKMREDADYTKAKMLYKTQGEKTEAKALFKEVKERHAFREYDLYAFCKQWNKKGNFLSIGARISQVLAKRAFQAVQEYKMGKRGKPRFKGYRGITSIEDNSIDANLRLKNNIIYYLGIQLPLQYNLKDPIHYHGLHAPIKYIRIVRKSFNGRIRYFAQLICEGMPWVKSTQTTSKKTVGLDVGPQTLAIVAPSSQYAQLKTFADELKCNKKRKNKLQKKWARKMRINNPDLFEKDKWTRRDKHWQRKKGKNIKGKRMMSRSKAMRRIAAQLADVSRREASFRKSQHGRLINEILNQGNHIKTEKLSYKAFQKLFGSSVGLRAPGMFIEHLKRKAENAGGKVEEINTWSTKLSQSCHCGAVKKKPLSLRWHHCDCGVEAQRDLYSAYLACFVEKNKLIADQASKAWSGMDIALRTAMIKLKSSSSGHQPASLGLSRVRGGRT